MTNHEAGLDPTFGAFVDRPLVYIAGPYSQDDQVLNTRAAVLYAEALEKDANVGVVIPHLSMLWHTISPADYFVWLQRDLIALSRCDALVRIPGDSRGADNEILFAQSRGIPTFAYFPEMLHHRFASTVPNLVAFRDWRNVWKPS